VEHAEQADFAGVGVRVVGGAKPRVSIGLPVYNGETYLEVALDSLLAQTFEDLQLISVDNSSTDRTEEICHVVVLEAATAA
jgi:cellulose synthase/poly-beta-1,6-N-acetylglucosamine synthase-like glycosyltransferase